LIQTLTPKINDFTALTFLQSTILWPKMQLILKIGWNRDLRYSQLSTSTLRNFFSFCVHVRILDFFYGRWSSVFGLRRRIFFVLRTVISSVLFRWASLPRR